jgi:GNAT superfamily N-acetyltransferase
LTGAVTQSSAALALTPAASQSAAKAKAILAFQTKTDAALRSMSFHIRREADSEGGRVTAERLSVEVAEFYGSRDEKPFILTASDPAGVWIGGLNGVIHWRWLYIAQLFVAPDRRGLGVGRGLLAEAEALAREHGCVGMYLDSFSPRALDFYRANGFAVFGRIENFPPGAARTFLKRTITPASA